VPKLADPSLRTALIVEAARLIAEEGSAGLSLRRLANAVGTSTMAIYTHFGSMDEVRRAVRREGFARLAAHLDAVEETGDAVADLLLLGWAYQVNALTNPNLYRVMFMEHPIDDADASVGSRTFDHLVAAVERCVRAGRFKSDDVVMMANQLWALQHGVATLRLAGLVSPEVAIETLTASAVSLFKAFGDDVRATGRSLTSARQRIVAGARVASP
jgi:AcrR family transcriptional regulator